MPYAPKWATNIWANVRKFEDNLNPKSGKMRFELNLIMIVFGHFYRNDSIKVSFDG
jgi:hypothetical protein